MKCSSVSSFAMGQAKQMGVQLNLVDPTGKCTASTHPKSWSHVIGCTTKMRPTSSLGTESGISTPRGLSRTSKKNMKNASIGDDGCCSAHPAAGPCLATNSHRQQSTIYWVTTNPTIGTHFFFGFLRFRAWQTVLPRDIVSAWSDGGIILNRWGEALCRTVCTSTVQDKCHTTFLTNGRPSALRNWMMRSFQSRHPTYARGSEKSFQNE